MDITMKYRTYIFSIMIACYNMPGSHKILGLASNHFVNQLRISNKSSWKIKYADQFNYSS